MQSVPAGDTPAHSANIARALSIRLGVLSLLARAYTDKRANVSRPKLLMTVAALDGVAIIVCGRIANSIAPGHAAWSLWGSLTAVGIALLIISALHMRWSYTISALRHVTPQVSKIFPAVLIVFLGFAGLSFVFEVAPWPPATVIVWVALSINVLGLIRMGTARVIAALTDAGRLLRRTVIVGGGKDGDEVINALGGPGTHLQILGVFDDRSAKRCRVTNSAIARLGTFEDLAAFCQSEGVELLIVTVPLRAEERLLQILQRLFALQVDVRVSALGSKLRLNASAYHYIGKVPMLAVMDKPLGDWDRVLKSIEDRVLGALLLVVLSPVLLLVALAVRLDSKGPVLFKQKRYGFDNELVEIYKFRSMYVANEDATANRLVTRGDPRVTRVGRFIRRASLDELPQLFNVLLGQMSLVGPRPHATQAKAGGDLYQDVVQGYFARHRVKPGVTGWAQINGWRGETDTSDKIKQRVEHDLHYIDNWSVLFDLYILAMTPVSLISTKNAY
jgi:Undecaprenyl-phosphate glucose phosphotransferase